MVTQFLKEEHRKNYVQQGKGEAAYALAKCYDQSTLAFGDHIDRQTLIWRFSETQSL